MATFPLVTEKPDAVIDVERGHSPPNSIGELCLATYTDENSLVFINVPGVTLPAGVFSGTVSECIPASRASWAVNTMLAVSEAQMANWVLISSNELINRLNAQTASIVSQVGSGGTPSGGFTAADRNVLNSVWNEIQQVDNNMANLNNLTLNKFNLLNLRLNSIENNMLIDTEDIIFEIQESGLGVGDGLLDGIGAIIDFVVGTIDGMILNMTDAITALFQWSDGLIASIEQSFALRMSEVAQAMTGTLGFMSSELFAGFSALGTVVESGISTMGDVADFLTMDFMEFWAETFDINIDDMETTALEMIQRVKTFMQSVTTITNEAGQS